MKTLRHTIVTAAVVFGLIASVQAGDADEASAPEATKEMKNQTHCPVMGGKIDSTAFTDIQGQRVYHCCPMCSAKLKADPDKYFKEAAEQGVLFENIQTTCPVSGHELGENAVSTDFEGRHLKFCSDKCLTAFNEDPAKFLEEMDKENKSDSEEMSEMKMDHGDQDGHDN